MDIAKVAADAGGFLVVYGPWVVTAAAAAAAALPQPEEGTIWAKVRKAIDWLAMNFGNAKNAPKAK